MINDVQYHRHAKNVVQSRRHAIVVVIVTGEAENAMKSVADRKNENIRVRETSDVALNLAKNVGQDRVNVTIITIITRRIATTKILKMNSRVIPNTKRKAKSTSKLKTKTSSC